MSKSVIKEVVAKISPYNFDNDLTSVRNYIDSLIAEHGGDAILDFDSTHYFPYDPNPSPQFELYIRREENNEEYEMRKNREVQHRLQTEEQEKKQLEILKAKYGENDAS